MHVNIYCGTKNYIIVHTKETNKSLKDLEFVSMVMSTTAL